MAPALLERDETSPTRGVAGGRCAPLPSTSGAPALTLVRCDGPEADSRRPRRPEPPSLLPVEQQAVLERFREGDPDAVRELYRRYAGAVQAVAMRSLGDRSLAEEAVQQTFVQAWRAADRIDPSRDPAPWLYTIARRVAIDLYRREDRRRADSYDAEDATSRAADQKLVSLPPSLDQAWDAWQVRLAVDGLSPDERDVVRLQHFDQLSHQEISERLGVPVGTVKSRSHRAHRRLAAALGHLAGAGDEGAALAASGGEAAALAPELEAERAALGWSATWDEPDGADDVVAAIAAERDQAAQVPASIAGDRPGAQRARRAWRLPAAGAAAAALVLVLVLAGGRTQPDVTVDLAGTELAPEATGRAEATGTDGGWRVELSHELPEAPDGSFYEAWSMGPQGPTSLGTFRGGGPVVLWAGVDVRSASVLVVTLEPDDGDPDRSEQTMLRGEPRQP